MSAIRKWKGSDPRGGLPRWALRARDKAPISKRSARAEADDEEKSFAPAALEAEEAGTAITGDRSLVAVDLSRLSIVLLAGTTLGFLLSPLSPFAWAHERGLFVVAGLPVAVTVVALIRMARG